MSLRRRLGWVAGGIVASSLGAYVAAYLILPRHWSAGGARTWQVRAFQDGALPYLFAPAGFMEASFIRVARIFRGPDLCGQEVVLVAPGVRFRFRATPGLPPNDAPLSDQIDILTFAGSHPPYPGSYQQRAAPGSELHDCLYYDCDVERAAEFLRDRYPRPYTVTKVIGWYEEAADEKTRVHLLFLLSASRDPRAALVLGAALRSPSLLVRGAAMNGLNWQFGAERCGAGGGFESSYDAAWDWLEENHGRLWKQARRLPLN